MWKLIVSVAALSALGLAAPRPAAEDAPADARYDGTLVVALEVPDVRAAAAWYEQAFGCRTVLDLSEMGWIEVSTPAAGAVIGLGAPEPGAAPRPNGGSRISFGVRDIAAFRAALAKAGATVGEIETIPETVELLEVTDPWGNGLMLHRSLAD